MVDPYSLFSPGYLVPTAAAINTAFATAGTSQIAVNNPNAANTFTYAVSTAPLNGTVSVSSTGLATYTPNTGFAGADSFVVTVTDNGTPRNSGRVTISVSVAAAFVVDTTAPVITMLGQSPVSVIQGITYTDAGATALDNVDGNLTGSMIVNNLVNTSVLGRYTVTYNVADTAGNGALQVTRTVNVVVDKPPVITLIGATPVTVVRGATYKDRGATAIDDVDGNITSKIAIKNHVNSAVVGTYTVTYDISDAAGHATAQVVRTVNVIPVGGAANADEAVQVPLTGSVVASAEVYSAGQVISNFSATGPTGAPPAGVAFPFGAISYTTTVPAGTSSQTVNLSFSSSLPANFTLYKVDGAGAYRIISNGIGVDQWTQLDATTIALTLKDGGTFDLDGIKNGIIVDPVAVGTPPASLAVSSGGGGCTINQSARFDPAMLLLILFSFAWLIRRDSLRRDSGFVQRASRR